MTNKWFKLVCKSSELQLLGTLNGGQSFRWKKCSEGDKDTWIGVFSEKLWILRQEDDCIHYQVNEPDSVGKLQSEDHYNDLLRQYFQLDLNLEEYYKQWSKSDKYFENAAKQFYGIRILKQDVIENIFSFICSSNNHITSLVRSKLEYGSIIWNPINIFSIHLVDSSQEILKIPKLKN